MALKFIPRLAMYKNLTRPLSSSAKNLVGVEVDNKTGIATVTLQNPPVNSLTSDLLTELRQVLDNLEKNKSRGIILISNQRTFSAGLDLLEIYKPNIERVTDYWKTLQDVYVLLYGSSYPTVAVINGAAPAGGCLLAVCCEYRVMVPNTFIGLNEAQLGITAPPWIIEVMVNTIGQRQTELVLPAGRVLSTDEALTVGLIDEIIQSKEEGIQKAQKYIGQFAKISPFARAQTKLDIRGGSLKRMISDRDNEVKRFVAQITDENVQKQLEKYIEILKAKRA